MRWLRADVLSPVADGRDELGNPVVREVVTATVPVRSTPWAPQGEGGTGNAFDMAERTFATRAAYRLLAGARHIEVDGRRYSVEGVARTDRMTLVRVRLAKPGGADGRI